MGEAKRRREAGEPVSWCRGCTLCCSIPEIIGLAKPMYRPCTHLNGKGCGVFGQAARPPVCGLFRCAYLEARETGSSERGLIPHPLEAGAYVARDPVERLVVVFVDPAKPELWKRSALVGYLRAYLQRGFAVQVIDRGRRMTIETPALFEQILKLDYVDYAGKEGRPLDFPSYAEACAAGM